MHSQYTSYIEVQRYCLFIYTVYLIYWLNLSWIYAWLKLAFDPRIVNRESIALRLYTP